MLAEHCHRLMNNTRQIYIQRDILFLNANHILTCFQLGQTIKQTHGTRNGSRYNPTDNANAHPTTTLIDRNTPNPLPLHAIQLSQPSSHMTAPCNVTNWQNQTQTPRRLELPSHPSQLSAAQRRTRTKSRVNGLDFLKNINILCYCEFEPNPIRFLPCPIQFKSFQFFFYKF